MPLEATAIYAALCAFLLVWLMLATIRRRYALKVSVGDGGDDGLRGVVRAHANAAETIPIFLILTACSESLGAPGFVLHALGLAFVIGRALHAWHFLSDREARLKDFRMRRFGMHLTIWPTLIMAVSALGHGVAAAL